jgi:hypothetical protein
MDEKTARGISGGNMNGTDTEHSGSKFVQVSEGRHDFHTTG